MLKVSFNFLCWKCLSIFYRTLTFNFRFENFFHFLCWKFHSIFVLKISIFVLKFYLNICVENCFRLLFRKFLTIPILKNFCQAQSKLKLKLAAASSWLSFAEISLIFSCNNSSKGHNVGCLVGRFATNEFQKHVVTKS